MVVTGDERLHIGWKKARTVDRRQHRLQRLVAGIPLSAWQRFIRIFSDAQTEAAIASQLAAIEKSYAGQLKRSPESREALSTD